LVGALCILNYVIYSTRYTIIFFIHPELLFIVFVCGQLTVNFVKVKNHFFTGENGAHSSRETTAATSSSQTTPDIHTEYDHMNYYRARSGVLETVEIANIIMMMEMNEL